MPLFAIQSSRTGDAFVIEKNNVVEKILLIVKVEMHEFLPIFALDIHASKFVFALPLRCSLNVFQLEACNKEKKKKKKSIC
jgi:hypothetical protein